MISRIVLLEPGVFDKRNVHPLKWWGEVYIADRLRMIKNCSIVIDVILLNIIATVPINATLAASLSLATLVVSAVMYVDDTDILITAKEGKTQQQLKKNAQTLINKWCSALWISGGCLRPDKCWWYYIDFK